MEREDVYNLIYGELKMYQGTVEADLYEDNRTELLILVSAMTDAALYGTLGIKEAVQVVRDRISTFRAIKTDLAKREENPEGSIKF